MRSIPGDTACTISSIDSNHIHMSIWNCIAIARLIGLLICNNHTEQVIYIFSICLQQILKPKFVPSLSVEMMENA